MKNISKFEKEKLLQLLECTEKELNFLINKSDKILQEGDNVYDILLKILQQGFNIREATLSGITLGERLGYKKAKIEMEEEIKEKLYRAFKNNQ
jgi:GTP-binding protein EngB required for normal cell division